ncbi:MAG: autoinducer binding domain-containing protein, partial [Amaricoccus sp.]
MASWAEESMREAVNLLARVGRNDLATDLNRIRAGVDFEDLDILRCAGAEQIADGIIEASSVSDLISFLSKLARAMNLTHCTLHVVSESATTNFSTRMLTTYPRRWISRYIDLKYFNVDPVVRACIEADRPFFWDCFD